MNTELPIARFCTFCSLLCELRSDEDNFGASFCSRRNAELDAIREWSESRETISSMAEWESRLVQARKWIENGTDLLVTGRMRCIDSSRGALRIAQRYRATVDSWESDAVFEAISGFQRVGAVSTTLSEARDLSELLIVVGGDALVEDYPRIPAALSRGASIPLLLLGTWSDVGCKPWLDAGFEVLAIDTPLASIPRSLAEASACPRVSDSESTASRLLNRAGYTSVLWSMKHVPVTNGDMWYEDMMEWIFRENERRRVAALCWNDLDAGFHQVCTWWTGFPGRIRFTPEGCDYDPTHFSAQRWLDVRTPQDSSLILWVDDSFEDLPSAIFESGYPCVAVSPRSPCFDPKIVWLPSLPAGLGCESEFFRGDQAILVHGRDPNPVAHELPSVSQWLKGLIEA